MKTLLIIGCPAVLILCAVFLFSLMKISSDADDAADRMLREMQDGNALTKTAIGISGFALMLVGGFLYLYQGNHWGWVMIALGFTTFVGVNRK